MATPLHTLPPDPPRPLTAAARRQSWMDQRVRSCWLLSAVSLAVIIPFVVLQLVQGRRGQRLAEHGIALTATIEDINGEKRNSYLVSQEEHLPVTLSFQTPGGEVHHVTGYLEGQESYIHPKEAIRIYVDPEEPDNWTDRIKPISLARELIAAAVLLPVVGILLAVALFLRGRVLALWVSGEAREALVVSAAQTAVAPRSYLVRCTARWGQDRTVIDVYIPQRLGRLETGDVIWIISAPGRPHRALAAAAYL